MSAFDPKLTLPSSEVSWSVDKEVNEYVRFAVLPPAKMALSSIVPQVFEDAHTTISYLSQMRPWNSSCAELARPHQLFSDCSAADTALYVIFHNGRVVTCSIIRHTEEVTYHARLEPFEPDAE
jgi:hypothetical protein